MTADLCQEHCEMLMELFKKFPKGKRGKGRQVHPVLSEAQIAKKAARPRVVKKTTR